MGSKADRDKAGHTDADRRRARSNSRSAQGRAWQYLYKTTRWQQLRTTQLRAHPLCKRCQDKGRVTAANVVHHVEPHNGDPVKFFAGKLESSCKPCHDSEAQAEEANAHLPTYGADGWIVDNGRPREERQYSIPFGLKPSAVPVIIVCGPPAAGKTTYVRQHAGPDDLVIDLDDILQGMGCKRWDADRTATAKALKVRDGLLRGLARRAKGKAWLIITAATDAERRAWQTRLGPATIHAIETAPAVCLQRLMREPERARARARLCLALDRYVQDRSTNVR